MRDVVFREGRAVGMTTGSTHLTAAGLLLSARTPLDSECNHASINVLCCMRPRHAVHGL